LAQDEGKAGMTGRTLLAGGRVLSDGGPQGQHADVLIDGETIAAVGAPGTIRDEAAERVDVRERLVVPGLVNAHTHAHGNLAKGSGDRWTLELLLTHALWIGAGRSEEHHELTALIGAAEMIRKGVTATYDLATAFPMPTPTSMAAVARGYAASGMRVALAVMTADRSFFQAIPGLAEALPAELRARVAAARAAPTDALLANCRAIVEGWDVPGGRVRPALAPTIPHHCTDDFLIGCRDLARAHGIGLHMHVGESKVQALVADHWYPGETLTRHLDRLGLLGPDFVAAHAIWLDDDDLRLLAGAGASVAHNPGSNLDLGNGMAATRLILERGVNVAIGTDGASSSDNLNMFEAMRFASYVSRAQSLDASRWLSAAEVFRAATVGGAKALGLEGRIGRVAAGYAADLVLLDLASMNWTPLNDALNQLVHCEDGTAVDAVMIGGRWVWRAGRHLTIDVPALQRRVAAAIEGLRAAGRELRDFADALAPHVARFCAGLAARPYTVDRLALHHHDGARL
jgi:5-methylthioadenosine/S-adenosylhomocysteine deaminase